VKTKEQNTIMCQGNDMMHGYGSSFEMFLIKREYRKVMKWQGFAKNGGLLSPFNVITLKWMNTYGVHLINIVMLLNRQTLHVCQLWFTYA
jgi:hypothetical protein